MSDTSLGNTNIAIFHSDAHYGFHRHPLMAPHLLSMASQFDLRGLFPQARLAQPMAN